MGAQQGKPVFPLADTRGPLGTHDDAYKFYFATLRDWSRNPASRRLTKINSRLGNPAPGVIATSSSAKVALARACHALCPSRSERGDCAVGFSPRIARFMSSRRDAGLQRSLWESLRRYATSTRIADSGLKPRHMLCTR